MTPPNKPSSTAHGEFPDTGLTSTWSVTLPRDVLTVEDVEAAALLPAAVRTRLGSRASHRAVVFSTVGTRRILSVVTVSEQHHSRMAWCCSRPTR